ncbi:hypothetical protein [Mesorhizobium sp. 113-3-9]|uniref:hypothetical protein n=1 Tax=Mesorhizobium sp. 113-3-9 TaxID=2744517 RepID=UPI00192569F1|nr:hypothetical protein [Mesorhizobium sp. 113-3-9]
MAIFRLFSLWISPSDRVGRQITLPSRHRVDGHMQRCRLALRRPMLDLFTVPFRPRRRDLLDQGSLSDHFLCDIGVLD